MGVAAAPEPPPGGLTNPRRVRTVHFLTIGQSPRPDVVPEIFGMLGGAAANIEDVEAGALDGLSREEVRAGAPRDGEMPLVSRLRSGEEVVIGEDFVEERMAALLRRIPAGDVAAILCTGPFSGIAERPGLVKAGPIFDRALREACPPGATVGMLIPEPRQEADARRRVPEGNSCVIGVASPYSDDGVEEMLAEAFREVDVVGLNCLGYNGPLEAAVARATGKRVVLARRALADAVAALVTEDRGSG